MGADTRVETNAVDDILRIQAAQLGVSIELVKVSNAEGEISIREELNRFGLGRAHEFDRDILFNRRFLEEIRESVSFFSVGADNNPRRVEIIVESVTFAEELRRENNMVVMIFLADFLGIADRDGGLNNNGSRVVAFPVRRRIFGSVEAEIFFDNVFDGASVEIIVLFVVVGRGSDNDEIFIGEGLAPIGRRGKV